jgi:hypothetical protein
MIKILKERSERMGKDQKMLTLEWWLSSPSRDCTRSNPARAAPRLGSQHRGAWVVCLHRRGAQGKHTAAWRDALVSWPPQPHLVKAGGRAPTAPRLHRPASTAISIRLLALRAPSSSVTHPPADELCLCGE